MRILHVFNFLSPNANGSITLIRQLSKALSKRGHKVGIFTSDFELSREYIESLHPVEIYSYSSWLNLRGLYLYLSPSTVLKAKAIVKEFDLIHLHCLRSLPNIVIHHYARKYNIPYIIDAHGSTPRAPKGGKGFRWLLRWLFDIAFGYRILRDASKIIAETEVGVNEYKELGVNQDKIVLISPPFDTEEFSQLPPLGRFRDKYNIKEKHIIMFLGRIHWIKGIDFLVESFYELARLRKDIILAIVGPDDGYKPTLEGLIEKLNLSDKVLFTGFLSGEEKLSALADADVVVQTSRYEQGAWAPFEAVLCNTPIIVTSNSGAGEDVRRIDAGYLVEWGNKGQLSNVMQHVLDNPEEAAIKTKKTKEYIETNLSMAKRIVEYEELYAKCIEENKLLKGNKE
jgi:glycosyltransferase involved in cell wall biosynthesis